MSKVVAISALLLGSLSLFAQEAESAIVVGSVFNPVQAAVDGASAQLVQAATKAVTEVHADPCGAYQRPPLRIGIYTVKVVNFTRRSS